jgi:preprotein translocase subunit SecY
MSLFANWGNISKLPELRRRIVFTLLMLGAYRMGMFVMIPGVDRRVVGDVVRKSAGGFQSLMNLLSGGAVERASVFTLSITPYITASIILQLLAMVLKPLEELRKEGEAGYRKINQYTRYGALLIAFGYAINKARELEAMQQTGLEGTRNAVGEPGWGFRVTTIITLVTGVAIMMWIGEQITERGIGNGTSLLIFAGIVDGVPNAVFQYFQTKKGDLQPLNLALICAVVLVTVAVIVFFERGQRRIPIYYARRTVGRRVYGGQESYLPIRVNTAGTIGPIFASSLIAFPGQLAAWFPNLPGINAVQGAVQRGDWAFNTVYIALIVFFCFFYTAVTFQAVEVADSLKKQQAFIPSIRQGKSTAEYIDFVLTRVTAGGALYVAAVCVIPTVLSQTLRIPFQWGGTSIMIVVGVALDTVNQIEAQSKRYDGVTSGANRARISGRRAG